MNEYMKLAKEMATTGMIKNEGGPFGAVVVDKEGNIIATGNNQDIIELHQIDRDACIETFEKYEQENKTIY